MLLKLHLPQRDLTFIQTALWKKLPAGDILKNWIPHATQCPLDGRTETITHALTTCVYLSAAFHIALQRMGPVIIGMDRRRTRRTSDRAARPLPANPVGPGVLVYCVGILVVVTAPTTNAPW